MIRHTPFKPLLLPSLIAGVLSASYSFNASADCFDDGYNAGKSAGYAEGSASCGTKYNDGYRDGKTAGEASCSGKIASSECTSYGYIQGQAGQTAVFLAANGTYNCPTTSTGSGDSCSGKIYVSECASNGYTQIPSGQTLVTIGQPYSCGTANTNNAYLAAGEQKYNSSTHEVVLKGQTYADGEKAAAAKFNTSTWDLTIPILYDTANNLFHSNSVSLVSLKDNNTLISSADNQNKAYMLWGLKEPFIPNDKATGEATLKFIAVGGSISTDSVSSPSGIPYSNTPTFDLDPQKKLNGFTVSYKLGAGNKKIIIQTPTNASWSGDCSTNTTIPLSTSCTVDLNKPYQTVVLAFEKQAKLKVTANTTLSTTSTTISATTTLNQSTNGSCSLDPASSVSPSSLTYTLFNSGSECTLTANDSAKTSLKVAAPAALPTFSAANSKLSLSATGETISLGTSTSVTVSATFKDSNGAAFSTGVSSDTVALFVTQVETSTGKQLKKDEKLTTISCTQNTCTSSLPGTITTASTVIVSGTLNDSPFGTPQIITFNK